VTGLCFFLRCQAGESLTAHPRSADSLSAGCQNNPPAFRKRFFPLNETPQSSTLCAPPMLTFGFSFLFLNRQAEAVVGGH
jgi:hypothetical protein